jgi:hypothetical protein
MTIFFASCSAGLAPGRLERRRPPKFHWLSAFA